MEAAPRLQTKRLILRGPTLDDWPTFSEIMASDRAKYMGGPYTTATAWGIFCQGVAGWQLFGLGALSIEHKSSGRYVGQVEINQGPRFPEPELGWQILADAEGFGYAYEAAEALRDWAFGQHGAQSLVSYIDPENSRSIRLAERLGALLDPVALKQDPEDLVYRHSLGGG